MISRRAFLGVAAVFSSAHSATAFSHPLPQHLEAPRATVGWYVGWMPDDPHDIPIVDLRRIHPAYWRQLVRYNGSEQPGTIVINTGPRFLYLTREDNTAIRYGIGVGREGFAWSGVARVQRKAKWPGWTPPEEMRRRQPELPAFMEGGLDNPLGARALYLYQNGRDTLYRIHGTNEPWSIGRAVSSGCIRLLNEDIVDLYDRVPLGTMVKVTHRVQPVGPAS
ncbi:L,D-transpeptidase [Microvirga sp. VF16]|uniref:L,D-transpeptidase n=1 Tax=Microvirga sp. VF16 TaxID=2807101 RepID=UPI00193D9016|nr:L,D-transpeptidase [Microvirga sp. VF16]QRM35294.1 L,D-transpeptidase [Microvirga sp. VF16]